MLRELTSLVSILSGLLVFATLMLVRSIFPSHSPWQAALVAGLCSIVARWLVQREAVRRRSDDQRERVID